MTIPSWPPSLPQYILADGYGETMPENRISSSPDIGPKKIRRRSTSAVRPVDVKLVMDKEQLVTFRSFYIDDLIDGTLRFSWTDPLDSASSVEMRFDPETAPSWTKTDGLFEVSFSLEILP